MLKRFLLVLCAFALLRPGVSVAESLTLTEFLSQVKQANPTLDAARARAEALGHRVGPVSSLDDPFVAVGIDEVPFSGGGSSVIRYQLSQSIPFPWKISAKGDAAQGRANAALADSETTARSLIVIATQAYYRTHFNHKALILNEESRRYIQNTIESTKARYQSGDASHHEWLLGKIELGVLEAEKLRLGREQKALHALLNELRNQLPEVEITLGEISFNGPKDIEANPKKLLANQPELKAAESASDSAEADERAAKFSYAPDFVIQGMAMQPRSMDMGQSANWGVMVGINLPIFFWRKQAELVRAAQADRQGAAAERKSLENRLNTEIIDAKEELKTARGIVSLYKKDVIPMTAIATENARSGYAAKRLPLTQLIDTLKVERVQHLELMAAQIDVEIAKTRLENLLSSPPLMKLAPSRPTVFGGSSMGSETSGTVKMGSGMSGPTRRESKSDSQGPSSSGMGSMQ
ncbi:TolC family protein [Bdellovibrionota bacterium FG-2]